ncbi:MAG: DEAD/DEAH box helicase, partial [Peptococcaceae bacterium]|nr:DEAD/DEAH box helicase [Peptococcaceae bacterium]
MTNIRFADYPISPEIIRAIHELGITSPTEIQEKTIPIMLEGRDVIGKAPTGTGKTFAFGIPILERLDKANQQLQALILSPTRELCTQICDDFQDLAKFMPDIRIVAAYGGQPINKQLTALQKKPQIVVATPGRLLDHLNRKSIRLNGVKVAILDEADEMLDMGFYKDVRKILDRLPKGIQLSMFSATMSREVMDISWLYQRDEVELSVDPVEDNQPKITQFCIQSQGTQKVLDIADLIRQKDFKRVMVFCNTKYATEALAYQLGKRGFQVACLNGDMPQKERTRIMSGFKAGKLRILISTNVASRGIDVDDVNAVINCDMPQDNNDYLHRIGRTGRARKVGVSYLFYDSDATERLDNLIKLTNSSIQPLYFDESRRLVETPT